MFWLDPVMNLISMLFHVSLVVVSHWIMRGLPSLVLLGVSGEGADAAEAVCRSTRLGMATTDETLNKAAREAANNFIVTVMLYVEEVGCGINLGKEGASCRILGQKSDDGERTRLRGKKKGRGGTQRKEDIERRRREKE